MINQKKNIHLFAQAEGVGEGAAPSPLLGASRTGAGRQAGKQVKKCAAIVYID